MMIISHVCLVLLEEYVLLSLFHVFLVRQISKSDMMSSSKGMCVSDSLLMQ
jgi:hypothetical protein